MMNELKFILKPGDIGFLMHRDITISRIIARFMKSRWSHSFLVKDVTNTDIYLLETSNFEVVIGILDVYLIDPFTEIEIWSPVDCSKELREEMVIKARGLLGTIYGYFQLLSFAIRAILSEFNFKIPNFIRQGIVCCGVPLMAYSISNIKGLKGIDPESIHTEEFYKRVKNSKQFNLVYHKSI